MTDEFAINIIEQYRKKPTLVNEIETVEEAAWLDEALDMAIKALEQEPCEDTVSLEVFEQVMLARDVAIEQLKELGYGFGEKQRTGHWIECEEEVKCFCSECKEISDYPTRFCPNCGAEMVEPQESEGDKE